MLIPLSFPLSFLTVLSCMWHTPVPQPSFALIRSSSRDGEWGRAAGKAGQQTAKQTRAPHSSTQPRVLLPLTPLGALYSTPHLLEYKVPKSTKLQRPLHIRHELEKGEVADECLCAPRVKQIVIYLNEKQVYSQTKGGSDWQIYFYVLCGFMWIWPW